MPVLAALMVTCADALKVWSSRMTSRLQLRLSALYGQRAGGFAVSTPLASVANEALDSVHSVLEVTSCVVPSLRCAIACRVTAPPTVTAEGVALIDRESRPGL